MGVGEVKLIQTFSVFALSVGKVVLVGVVNTLALLTAKVCVFVFVVGDDSASAVFTAFVAVGGVFKVTVPVTALTAPAVDTAVAFADSVVGVFSAVLLVVSLG